MNLSKQAIRCRRRRCRVLRNSFLIFRNMINFFLWSPCSLACWLAGSSSNNSKLSEYIYPIKLKKLLHRCCRCRCRYCRTKTNLLNLLHNLNGFNDFSRSLQQASNNVRQLCMPFFRARSLPSSLLHTT